MIQFQIFYHTFIINDQSGSCQGAFLTAFRSICQNTAIISLIIDDQIINRFRLAIFRLHRIQTGRCSEIGNRRESSQRSIFFFQNRASIPEHTLLIED